MLRIDRRQYSKMKILNVSALKGGLYFSPALACQSVRTICRENDLLTSGLISGERGGCQKAAVTHLSPPLIWSLSGVECEKQKRRRRFRPASTVFSLRLPSLVSRSPPLARLGQSINTEAPTSDARPR